MCNKELSVSAIFRKHWKTYLKYNKPRPVEIREVEKMLNCKDKRRGFWTCYCSKCNKYHRVYLGCNSRLCSSCGKRYSDQWAERLSKSMLKVPHQHIIFGLPPLLWHQLKKKHNLWKTLIDKAAETVEWLCKRNCGDAKPGIIAALHPFGRDLAFKPHIHIIATKGGFSKKGNFIESKKQIPEKLFWRIWMKIICKEFKKHINDNKLFDNIKTKYSHSGFVAHICPEKLISRKHLAKYISRYVRHPSIANSRILHFNEDFVFFKYVSHYTKRETRRFMKTIAFIEALLSHLPQSQFKMIRRYGKYGRRSTMPFLGSIVSKITLRTLLKCPNCQSIMKKIYFNKVIMPT